MPRGPLRRALRALVPSRPATDPASDRAAVDLPPDATPIDRYQAGRSTPYRSSICNAPFTNLYFAATGKVGPCWIQLDGSGEVWGPERSIRDIWTGPAFEHLRTELAEHRFPGACTRCGNDIEAGISPLAAVHDHDRPIIEWPTALELELSNLCNFECIMCTGDLSSKIRRNREHLPPLHVPYDDTFVDQVTELIPTLQQVRFSGGEPLLHPIMHKICERIIELRPDLRIDVSTNGSTLNDKVRRLLERAKVQINISFESLEPERYHQIRIGSDHAVLLANIEEFRRLVKPNGGLVTINTNPMRETWTEMASFVRFCDERELFLSYNTVLNPPELALHSLPPDELDAIVATLEAERFEPPASKAAEWNHAQFANLVEQVRAWATDAAGGPVPVDLSPRPSSAAGGVAAPAG